MGKSEKLKTGKSSDVGEFYTTDEIDSYHAHYNVIFGKRSDGAG